MISGVVGALIGAAVTSALWILDRTVLQRARIKGTIRDLARRWELGASDAVPHDSLVTLLVFVTNVRNVPVRIQHWTLEFRDGSDFFVGHLVPVQHVPQPGMREKFPGSPLGCLTNPLPSGVVSLDRSLLDSPLDRAGREGWLEFKVPGLAGRAEGRGVLTLALRDSLNREHRITARTRWTADHKLLLVEKS